MGVYITPMAELWNPRPPLQAPDLGDQHRNNIDSQASGSTPSLFDAVTIHQIGMFGECHAVNMTPPPPGCKFIPPTWLCALPERVYIREARGRMAELVIGHAQPSPGHIFENQPRFDARPTECSSFGHTQPSPCRICENRPSGSVRSDG